jgi:hypothetical protein
VDRRQRQMCIRDSQNPMLALLDTTNCNYKLKFVL